MEDNIEIKNIIELIYHAEDEKLDKKIKQINKNIKDKVKNINIEELLENTKRPNDPSKALTRLEENYSIKIAEYNKEFYKQGFIRGVNLIIDCLKR